MKRKIGLLLLAMMVLLASEFSGVSKFWAYSQESNIEAEEDRLLEVFETQIEIMKQYEWESEGKIIDEMNILSIEKIKDFEGNEYTLVECTPTGYMIYHNESGNFVEYSPVTNSPYYEENGERKYAGPNAYYIENKYGHIDILGNNMLSSTQVEWLKKTSGKINDTLNQTINKDIIDYIKGKTNMFISEGHTTLATESSSRSVTVDGWKYVKDYTFFTELKDCGYIDGGRCGYIAAAMLLAYDAVINGKDTMPLGYYDADNHALSPRVATRLYESAVELGYSSSTTSKEIHYTVKDWMIRRMLSVKHTSLWAPFALTYHIQDFIRKDRPVIWFGLIFDNSFDNQTFISHAVLVYGYYAMSDTTQFVAHFGWPGATKVYFSGALGSLYAYEW